MHNCDADDDEDIDDDGKAKKDDLPYATTSAAVQRTKY